MKAAAEYLKRIDWPYYGTIAGIIVSILCLALLFVQIVYPYDRFFPGQKIDGVEVGMMTHAEAKEKLINTYKNHEVKFVSYGRDIVTTNTDELGLNISVDNQINDAEYSLKRRVIPGSIIQAFFNDDKVSPEVQVDIQKVSEYLEKNYYTVCKISPTNATIAVIDDRLKLVDEIPGVICDPGSTGLEILTNPLTTTKQLTVEVKGREVAAEINTEKIRPIFENYRDQLIKGATISYNNNETLQIRYADIIKWLDISLDETGMTEVKYNDEKIREFLKNNLADLVKIDAGTTTSVLINEVEISRDTGNKGQELDFDREIAEIKESLVSTNTDNLMVALKISDPILKQERSYSKNPAGLAVLFEANFKKDGVGVSLADLGGRDLSRTVGGESQFDSPLATNIFTVYMIDWAVSNKKMALSDNLGKKKVMNCLDNLINSDDKDCRDEFIKKLGEQEITTTLASHGFLHTNLHDMIFATSSDDLQKLVLGVQNGTILSPTYRQKLSSKMSSSDLNINNDENDPLVISQIVTGGDGNFVITAFANKENRESVKTGIGYLRELFKK